MWDTCKRCTAFLFKSCRTTYSIFEFAIPWDFSSINLMSHLWIFTVYLNFFFHDENKFTLNKFSLVRVSKFAILASLTKTLIFLSVTIFFFVDLNRQGSHACLKLFDSHPFFRLPWNSWILFIVFNIPPSSLNLPFSRVIHII